MEMSSIFCTGEVLVKHWCFISTSLVLQAWNLDMIPNIPLLAAPRKTQRYSNASVDLYFRIIY